MTDGAPPDEVLALLRDRDARRADRDFYAADALRDRIADLGYRVVDDPGGSRLEPLADVAPPISERARPSEVRSVLDDPATADASIQWLVEGWPEDVRRGIASFRDHEGDRVVQHVVVDVAGAGTHPGAHPQASNPQASNPEASLAEVEVLDLVEGTGWATARNCGLRRATGRIVCVVDGSIEATGDVLTPLIEALADETVGIVGPFGVVTSDLRDFHESPGPEVDAIEGYLMAFRRELLAETGPFDEKFRFYRTCDIEFSFRVKDTGRRAVVVPVPLMRHEHRMWANTPEDRRERLSKRNYYRFLDRFRGRSDLTVAGSSTAH